MQKRYFALGCLLMMLAVGFGAFGAHGLKALLSDYYLEIFKTGVQYQFYHALGIILLSIASINKVNYKPAMLLMFLGIVCFSGSLYLLALQDLLNTNLSFLGPVTPLGGLLFIVAWGWAGYKSFKLKS